MKTEVFLIVIAVIAISALAADRCSAQKSAAPLNKDGQWVGTWASAPQLVEPGNMPPPPGLADTTLRQIVHVSLGGKWIRVKFSNAFGPAPLTITSAHVALSAAGSAIRSDSDKPLAFAGQASVTIPPGALAVSDPVSFDLWPLSDIVVTIHVNDPLKSITGHPGARCTSYLLAGDHVADADLPGAATTEHWYYLSGIDVLAKGSACAVAILGDSITDGRNSLENGNGRWPDNLARRLQGNKKTQDIAVLNQGIGGNRVLNDGLGPNGLARLDRDVLAQAGVRWLVVFEGINDLGTHSAKARDLIAAFQQIIARSHEHNILVYGTTITPCWGSFYFTPELEADRQAINTWIRTSGEFDAVIDFDAVARDPHNPTHLLAAVDGGDHLHPSNNGYKILADSIDLKLFSK